MVEISHHPVNLDNLMNEGIAFAFDRFTEEMPDCPIGQRPAMIMRSQPVYDTMEKVMRRLDRMMIMKVLEAMKNVVNVN